MKVAVGLFYLECNTFNPYPVTKEKFVYAEGEEVKRYIHVCDIFEKAGVEVVPTIMASTIPSSNLNKEDFLEMADRLLTLVKENNVDGVWLHLHGAMQVNDLGSGDLYVVRELRRIVGDDVPIGITMDAHANNDETLCDYINMLRGYHTIPHSDQPEAERSAAYAVLKMMQTKKLVKPALITVPVMISGEKGLGEREPLKSMYAEVEELESRKEIESATVFMGDPWSDCANGHLSAVVVPSAPEYEMYAKECCRKLAQELFDRREEFVFEAPTLRPQEALDLAAKCGNKPVFLSDSGDNTTGGGVGDGTEMLRLILAQKDFKKKVLLTPIWDEACYREIMKHNIGDVLTVKIGRNASDISVPVELNATLYSCGDVLGYLNSEGEVCGHCCTLRVNEYLDVMVSDSPTSFISYPHFGTGGVSMEDYDIIVLKQGYLFAQLRPYTTENYIMAATKGATYQFIEELSYQNVQRPIYPLDKNIQFKA